MEPYPCDAPLDINITRVCLQKNPIDQNISLEEAIDVTMSEININEETDRAVKLLDDGNSSGFESYLLHMDVFHDYFTKKVHVISSNIDITLSETIESFEDNSTEIEEKPLITIEQNGMPIESISEKFDKFFNDETYLDANNISFMMVRLGYRYDRKGENEFVNKIRFSIKLPKSSHRLKLFFGEGDEEVNTINDALRLNESSSLGLRYFAPSRIEGLKSSFSVGIRGFNNPYVRARFEYPINYSDIYIRLIQSLRYAYEEKFEEKTDLFFDYKSAEREMIRLHFHRETLNEIPGMLFSSTLTHMTSFNIDDALQVYVSLSGSTENSIDPKLVDFDPKPGVTSYSIGAGWRQRLFRKYLFFDIGPALMFAQQYKYKGDFLLGFNLELYFGNI